MSTRHRKIRIPIIPLPAVFLMVCIQIQADEIVLSNGQSAPTTILDTAGCEITIKRRGKETKIKKEVIDRVVWKTDTIDYASYKCEEKPKEVVKFSETPEYKLMAFIDNCPELEQEFEEGRDVAYLIAPLQGDYNAEEFMAVHKTLLEILRDQATLVRLTPEELVGEVRSKKPKYKYAFVARKYNVLVHEFQEDKGLMGNSVGNAGNWVWKKQLITHADYVMLDLERKETVFHPKAVKKRKVGGDSEYSFTGLLTPDKWEEEWTAERTERVMDRNARSITKKLARELEDYLGE